MTNTSYSARPPASASQYEGRKNEDDFGIGLDYDDALMQDESGNYVVFHTGINSASVAAYTPRPTVNT